MALLVAPCEKSGTKTVPSFGHFLANLSVGVAHFGQRDPSPMSAIPSRSSCPLSRNSSAELSKTPLHVPHWRTAVGGPPKATAGGLEDFAWVYTTIPTATASTAIAAKSNGFCWIVPGAESVRATVRAPRCQPRLESQFHAAYSLGCPFRPLVMLPRFLMYQPVSFTHFAW